MNSTTYTIASVLEICVTRGDGEMFSIKVVETKHTFMVMYLHICGFTHDS